MLQDVGYLYTSHSRLNDTHLKKYGLAEACIVPSKLVTKSIESMKSYIDLNTRALNNSCLETT